MNIVLALFPPVRAHYVESPVFLPRADGDWIDTDSLKPYSVLIHCDGGVLGFWHPLDALAWRYGAPIGEDWTPPIESSVVDLRAL